MGIISSLPWKPIKGHSRAHVFNNIKSYEEAFSARYKAAYMWYLVQSIEKEIEGKAVQNKWQLAQRKWNSYNRSLKQGFLYVLTKRGSKWKKRYCVLRPDYALEVYKSKEDFDNSMKPCWVVMFSGFIVTGDVDGYLYEKLTIAARDFGYVNPDINAFAKRVTKIGLAGNRPTQHVFLVDHPWRGCTYFATDMAIEKDQWLRVLGDSIRHLVGCQCDDEVGREAFCFAVEQSVRLQEFYVDRSMLSGTQEEILTDLIAAFQSVDCREVVLPRITGGIVNKYKAWNFVLTTIHEIINGVVHKKYLAWKNVWEENCHNKRQDIIEHLPDIKKAYQNTSLVIKVALAECFDPIVQEKVLSRLPEVVNIMSDSLVSPLRTSRQLFKTLVEGVQKQVSSSPQFTNNIDQYFLNTLDFAPRDPEFTCPSGEMSTHQGSSPVAFLKNIFPKNDFSLYMKSVYTYQQQLLDSAVHAFEAECGEVVNNNDGKLSRELVSAIEERVLKNLDYDILLAQKRFFRIILQSATMECARESIEHYCKPKMLEFESTIPEHLRCYLPINNLFTDVLTKRFGELVNPALTSCMRRIGSDVLTHSSLRPNNEVGSLASFATIESEDEHSKLHDMDVTTKRGSYGNILVNGTSQAARHSQGDITLDEPYSPNSTSPAQPCDDTGECYVGDMDGETGEWFPPANSSGQDHPTDPPDGGYVDSDTSSSDDGGYCDRLSKEVAKEFLDSSLDEELDSDEPCTSDCPVMKMPKLNACSMLLNHSAPPSYHMMNGELQLSTLCNDNPHLSETGEPSYMRNGNAQQSETGEPSFLRNDNPQQSETGEPSFLRNDNPQQSETGEPSFLRNDNPQQSETGEPSYMRNGNAQQSETGEPSYMRNDNPQQSETGEPSFLRNDNPQQSETGEPSYMRNGNAQQSETGEPSYMRNDNPQQSETGEPSFLRNDNPQQSETGEPSFLRNGNANLSETGKPSYLRNGNANLSETGEPSYLRNGNPQQSETGEPLYLCNGNPHLSETGEPSYLRNGNAHLAETGEPSYLRNDNAHLSETGEPSYLRNDNAHLAETGEPSYFCNSSTKHNGIGNGTRKLGNYPLAT